jgi:hypothetical protein
MKGVAIEGKEGRAYLFVGKPKFVLQNGLLVAEELDIICEDIKVIS